MKSLPITIIKSCYLLLLLAACSEPQQISTTTQGSVATGSAVARDVVARYCRATENTLGLLTQSNLPSLQQVFGEAKVNQWCGCAYESVAEQFTSTEIAAVPSSGIIDNTAQAIQKEIYSSLVECMREDNQISEKGMELKNSYADMISIRLSMLPR